METEQEYIKRRLQEELALIEEAKKRNREHSKKSFEVWLKGTVEKVGRAFGYRINIAKEKLGHIYDWLFN